MSIAVLLNDQYSSSQAEHAPGDDDPLNTINVDYTDKYLTKKRRMES